MYTKNNNCTINYWIKHNIIVITGMLKCHLNLKLDFKNSDVLVKTVAIKNKIKYIHKILTSRKKKLKKGSGYKIKLYKKQT